MKGCFVILGCLFAAYAAPLFGNEVPLILEEVISLPHATTTWDVVPTWLDGFYWVSAVESPDSNTRVYFGNTMWMTEDSTNDVHGVPISLSGFLSEGSQLSMALSTYRYHVLDVPLDSVWAVDTSWTRFEMLPGRESVATMREFTGYQSVVNHLFYTANRALYQYFMSQFEPVPPPPEICESMAGLLKVTDYLSEHDGTWGDGASWTNFKGKPILNAFEESEFSLPEDIA